MAECCAGYLDSYFDIPASGDSSNVTASNIWTSNIWTSNLWASNGTVGILSASTLTATAISAATVTSGVVSAGTVTGCNLTAFSNAISSNVTSLSNDFASLSNSLGTAAYCNVSAFMPASNLTYASASSSGFLTQPDWVRFNSNAGMTACNQFASLYASNAFMSNIRAVSSDPNTPTVRIVGTPGLSNTYIQFNDAPASGSNAAANLGVNTVGYFLNYPTGGSNQPSRFPTLINADGTMYIGDQALPSSNIFVSSTHTRVSSNLWTSNIYASNLGTASGCNASAFMPASNLTYAGASSSGLVTSTDWNTFNNKQAASNFTYASASSSGFLTQTDWVRFNSNSGGGSGCNMFAALYASNAFMSNATINNTILQVNGAVAFGRSNISGNNTSTDAGSLNLTSGGDASGRAVITYGNNSTAANNWHVVTGDNSSSFNWYNGNYGSGSLRMYLANTGRLYLSGSASYIQFNDTGTSTTTNVGNGGGNFFVQVNSGSYPIVINNSTLLTQMQGVYNNTTASGSANILVTATGQMLRISSSLRYKTNIRYSSNIDWNMLKIRPAFFDAINGSGVDAFGAIAEDVHALGCTHLVEYDDQGRPDSLSYDRFACAMLPMMSNLVNRIVSLESKVARLLR